VGQGRWGSASGFDSVANLKSSIIRLLLVIAVCPMLALAYGLGLLVLTSYPIALDSHIRPAKAVPEHISSRPA
jgi:hypothetical protein